MGDGVGTVGCIQEEHPWFAVMVSLLDDLGKEFAGADRFVGDDGVAVGLDLVDGAFECFAVGVVGIGEAQCPFFVVFDSAHEIVGDPDGDVKVGDRVFVGLAGDKVLDIGVVHTQNSHISAAAGAALGDLAKGIIVNA